MHLADCPPPSFGLDSRSPLNDAFARSSDDNEFHSLKYTLTVQFSKVADVLAAPDLPSYDVVMKLDGELRAIEAAAPTWLRWREYDVITENLDPVSRARKASQQHQAALLIHKALLGEIGSSFGLLTRSPTSALVQQSNVKWWRTSLEPVRRFLHRLCVIRTKAYADHDVDLAPCTRGSLQVVVFSL